MTVSLRGTAGEGRAASGAEGRAGRGGRDRGGGLLGRLPASEHRADGGLELRDVLRDELGGAVVVPREHRVEHLPQLGDV